MGNHDFRPRPREDGLTRSRRVDRSHRRMLVLKEGCELLHVELLHMTISHQPENEGYFSLRRQLPTDTEPESFIAPLIITEKTVLELLVLATIFCPSGRNRQASSHAPAE